MSSDLFQKTHSSINQIGIQLLQYLHEIRQARISEGDEKKSLQSIEDDINKALTALKEQKYQVAVIAAMKAGKSTFLNAIIGADVLASETAACTICRTDVKHIPINQNPRLLEYQEGKIKPIILVEGKAEEIQQEIQNKFLKRTREIRETGNPDNTTRFEIEHPIEAISSLSSLSGFTLVDTPGPNEWESANFNTVALKQTALEALRTCNAILFVLNYASYKDNAVSDLFKDIVENRKEILAENTGKIYFILNKVDQKTRKDKEINDVIEDLKRELSNFGFPNPIIYPASSRQGLLAKLIIQGKATESQIGDFDDCCASKYAVNRVIPLPHEIAPQALVDSGIPKIQETVIQTIIQNSGWNLLSDVLASIEKSAKAIEDSLTTQIRGWETELETLKQKVADYRERAEYSKSKVQNVKNSIEEQKKILISEFSQGVNQFSDGAKAKIQAEIEQISQALSTKQENYKPQNKSKMQSNNTILPSKEVKLGFSLPNWLPLIGGLSFSFETKTSLVDNLKKAIPIIFDNADDEYYKSPDPYKIRCKTQEEAENIKNSINEYCTPHIKTWWLNTQDTLVRHGTQIREELVRSIQNDIQEISDELSSYLGESLQVKLNINSIQFPDFEFSGIDAKIQKQQETYQVFIKNEDKKKEGVKDQGFCEDDKEYKKRAYEEVPVYDNKQRQFYEIDLHDASLAIQKNITNKSQASIDFLTRIVEKQIYDDFRNAEKQISDYIKRFQNEFDFLLKERETKQTEEDKIRETLNLQKENLNKYLHELNNIKASLNQWKPR
jgi:GTPase Era involved in 16S rRNA processing